MPSRIFLKNARVVDGTGAPGEYAKAIQVFVDVIGFTPMQDRIGTLEAGKLADLVVVSGDPLKDISVLQDRSRLSVMKGGRFVTRNLS